MKDEISEPEPISLHDIAYGHLNPSEKLLAPATERVELAPLAAGIDPSRKISQEISVKLQPNKPLVQLLGVYAGQDRPQTASQHLTSQVGRVVCGGLDREEGLYAGPLQEPDPVLTDVFEERVAERNVCDARRLRLENRRPHPILVDLV